MVRLKIYICFLIGVCFFPQVEVRNIGHLQLPLLSGQISRLVLYNSAFSSINSSLSALQLSGVTAGHVKVSNLRTLTINKSTVMKMDITASNAIVKYTSIYNLYRFKVLKKLVFLNSNFEIISRLAVFVPKGSTVVFENVTISSIEREGIIVEGTLIMINVVVNSMSEESILLRNCEKSFNNVTLITKYFNSVIDILTSSSCLPFEKHPGLSANASSKESQQENSVSSNTSIKDSNSQNASTKAEDNKDKPKLIDANKFSVSFGGNVSFIWNNSKLLAFSDFGTNSKNKYNSVSDLILTERNILRHVGYIHEKVLESEIIRFASEVNTVNIDYFTELAAEVPPAKVLIRQEEDVNTVPLSFDEDYISGKDNILDPLESFLEHKHIIENVISPTDLHSIEEEILQGTFNSIDADEISLPGTEGNVSFKDDSKFEEDFNPIEVLKKNRPKKISSYDGILIPDWTKYPDFSVGGYIAGGFLLLVIFLLPLIHYIWRKCT